MGDLVDVVSGDLLVIGDESEKEGQLKMVKFKGKSERVQEEGNISTASDAVGGIECAEAPF